MTRTRRCTLGIGAVALAAVAAGAPLGGGGAASARTPSALGSAASVPAHAAASVSAHAAASRGFKIFNRSSHALRVISVAPWHRFGSNDGAEADFTQGRPDDGSLLEPGRPPHVWELKYNFLSFDAAMVSYAVVGTNARFTAWLDVNTVSNNSWCSFDPEGGPVRGVCTAEGLTLTVSDPPGTVVDVPAGQGAEQAQWLKDLCDRGNTATCSFSATGEDKDMTPSRIVGRPLANCTTTDQQTRFTAEERIVQSNSTGLDLQARPRIAELAESAVRKRFGHGWKLEHTFRQDISLTVKPGYIGWVRASAPVYRHVGDFTIELGNTTWRLRGVSIETPDSDQLARFVADTERLGDDEYEDACKHRRSGPDGLTKASRSDVPDPPAADRDEGDRRDGRSGRDA